MTDDFRDPAPAGDKLPLAELNGALLLFDVKDVAEAVPTVHGTADAVRADVAVLDGDSKGEEFFDTLIFPRVLVSSLRSSVGQKVLGRLGQGQAKPGQSPPWTLTAATDTERETGRKFLVYRTEKVAASEEPF